jgi:hypothetical protein
MKLAKSIWKYVSLLSLDVVFGAMAGMLFFSRLLRVDHTPEIYLLLGMAVWCIYTGDHLLDARQAERLVSPRHQFHRKYKNLLFTSLLILIFSGVFGAISVFGWGKELILSVALGAFIVMTMILLRKAGKAAGFLKEFSTAVFYVLGVAWIPLLRMDLLEFNWKISAFVVIYILLALLNLLMLSVLDRSDDQDQGFSSAASRIDPFQLVGAIRRLNFLLIFLCLGGFIFLNSFFRPYACMLLLMALVHYLSFFNSEIGNEAKRKRMEASFLLPWLLLVI